MRFDTTRSVMRSSCALGAGRVLVSEIDGYPVEVTGNYHTIVLVAEDVKGSVARIAAILAEHNLNIPTLKLTRKERGGDAFMVIESTISPATRCAMNCARCPGSGGYSGSTRSAPDERIVISVAVFVIPAKAGIHGRSLCHSGDGRNP